MYKRRRNIGRRKKPAVSGVRADSVAKPAAALFFDAASTHFPGSNFVIIIADTRNMDTYTSAPDAPLPYSRNEQQ